ncbi:hypothetical protein [Streptomyces lydicus]|uniref:hypothetical protein n=1 Tax=Streptomyces lydicus TaxID=47763 RepID=UPI0034433797
MARKQWPITITGYALLGTIPPRAASSEPLPAGNAREGRQLRGRVDSPALTEVVAQDGVVLSLFDNLDAMLICAFKRENALCESDAGPNEPRQYDCRPGCGNAVRTDTHTLLLGPHTTEQHQDERAGIRARLWTGSWPARTPPPTANLRSFESL